jgi:hypothetical protein
MKIKRALIQAGKVTIAFAIFLILFALFLMFENGPRNFIDFHFARLVALGVPMLVVLAMASFAVSLIPKR